MFSGISITQLSDISFHVLSSEEGIWFAEFFVWPLIKGNAKIFAYFLPFQSFVFKSLPPFILYYETYLHNRLFWKFERTPVLADGNTTALNQTAKISVRLAPQTPIILLERGRLTNGCAILCCVTCQIAWQAQAILCPSPAPNSVQVLSAPDLFFSLNWYSSLKNFALLRHSK